MFAPLLTAIAAVRSVVTYALVSLYVLAVAPPGLLIAMVSGRSWILYWLARQGVRLGLMAVGIRYRVVGAQHVDRERASVYCVNHASNVEPPVIYMALAAVHPKLRVLYKAEIHRIPLLSTVFDTAGFVPIQRKNREQSREAIDTAAAALRAGNSFLIFPEGTRSRTGALLPFKKGGFVMADRGQAAVVPMAILGTHEAMGRGSAIIRPVTITVRIGAPIDTASLDGTGPHALLDATRAAMVDLLAAGH
ncbi:MAG: lysophospholipid acyltransferase family protein [Acidobacteria bacterium]|nr:lysophospholipid acyltransferase family protein [Acidobacteriota bacterium]